MGGGNRGGREYFNWNQVKQMDNIDRDHYIGHSVMATMGRWQTFKDVLWYTRKGKNDKCRFLNEELSSIKKVEEETMKAIFEAKSYRSKLFELSYTPSVSFNQNHERTLTKNSRKIAINEKIKKENKLLKKKKIKTSLKI